MVVEQAALPGHIADAIASDPHRLGSIDRILLERQVWLTAASQAALYLPPQSLPTAGAARPFLARVVAAITKDATHDFQRASALRRWVAAVPRTYPEGGRPTRAGFWGEFGTFLCGGAEEEVIKKGSPLAAELSRVLVALAQAMGLPARLVFLYADAAPIRHTVAEIFVTGRWSVFDPISDRCFAWSKHGYASAWEIRQQPWLLDRLQDHARLPYVASRFYASAAIAAYDPWDTANEFPWDPVDTATVKRLCAGEAS
jgi:hypothetical protein